uniref:Protein Wnt n=1 Tax=Haemonchus placei TaxID=6290 RepID=A0A0N4X9B6_HAEPC
CGHFQEHRLWVNPRQHPVSCVELDSDTRIRPGSTKMSEVRTKHKYSIRNSRISDDQRQLPNAVDYSFVSRVSDPVPLDRTHLYHTYPITTTTFHCHQRWQLHETLEGSDAV